MLENLESLDIFEENGIDNLYNLFKTSSSNVNLELLSKFQEFSTSSDFFKHYMNKDIHSFFSLFQKLEENYSTICNNDNYINFNSCTDKYISILSNLIILLHLILKNRKIIKSTITNLKHNLIKYNSEYIIDCDFYNKMNEYINSLLNLSLINDPDKINNTSTRKDNLSTANITNTSVNSIFKDKIIGNEENNFYDMTNEDMRTPFFVSKSESLINNIEILNNNNNNINLIICRKKDSIGSILNLPCTDFSLEKSNLNKQDSKTNNFSKINNSNEKIKHNSNNDLLNNIKLINKLKGEKIKKVRKKTNKEKDKKNNKINNLKRYEILLKNVNELYKNHNINSIKKKKIKQLIISDSSKVKELYNYYCKNDINKYVEYLEGLL